MEKVKVKLANRVLEIPAEDKDKYIQQGYTAYDMKGKLIEEPPTDANRLKAAQEEIMQYRGDLERASEAVEKADQRSGELQAKLDESAAYAEKADERIASLEAELAGAKEQLAKKDAEITSLTENLKAVMADSKTTAKKSAKADSGA